MKNFSEIAINSKPKSNTAIEYAVSISGLPFECCKTLYESMKYSTGKDEISQEEAMQMFNDYFRINKPVDINIFSEDVIQYLKDMGDVHNNSVERRKATDSLLSLLKRYLIKKDTPSMLEVLACILGMKDSSKKGKMLLESIGFGKTLMSSLMENDNIDLGKWNSLNIIGTNYQSDNDMNRTEDIRFYDELKYLLNDRFKDYSEQPNRIRDIYTTIMDYVNEKGLELQSESMIRQTDENLYTQMLKDILNSSSMDPRYYSPDYLKTITSDMQTLLFDMMAIVNTFMRDSYQKYGNYIDPIKVQEYKESMKVLLGMISSSALSSYFTRNNSIMTASSSDINSNSQKSTCEEILYIASCYDFVNIRNLGRVSQDCLQIIKSITGEFNLKIRRMMNLYFSKSMELIHSYKNVDSALANNTMIMR